MSNTVPANWEEAWERLAKTANKPIDDVKAAFALRDTCGYMGRLRVIEEGLGLTRNQAHHIVGLYRRYQQILDGVVLARKSSAIKLPTPPSEFQEAMVAFKQYERLRAERISIDHQIDVLKAKQLKIDKDMELYKPVMEAAGRLQKAVNTMRQESKVLS